MQIHRLISHPARPPGRVMGVRIVSQFLPQGELLLRWRIDGAQELVLPPYAGSGRGDDLWKTTCFELFLDRGGGAYREFNFSPSGRWAAYDFSSYRERIGNAEMSEQPVVTVERGDEITVGTVRLPLEGLTGARLGTLTAVIEEKGAAVSFWAPAHRKEQPDFHDQTCFTIDFGAPLKP